MKTSILVASTALIAIALAPATYAKAQSVEEIVVTGSRAMEWNPDDVPTIQLPRRADNLIVEVRVVNDTRDALGRRSEITQTLRRMSQSAAARPDIDLSIDNDGLLVSLTESMVSTLTLGIDGNRADTSVARVVVKTPIRADDTLDRASQRIETFVKGVELNGRSLITVSGEWKLSIVDPPQYRPAILTLMAADSRNVAAAFGEDYAIEVEGLSNRVTWRQSGPLELSLFIPYKMKVTPKP